MIDEFEISKEDYFSVRDQVTKIFKEYKWHPGQGISFLLTFIGDTWTHNSIHPDEDAKLLEKLKEGLERMRKEKVENA